MLKKNKTKTRLGKTIENNRQSLIETAKQTNKQTFQDNVIKNNNKSYFDLSKGSSRFELII